MKSLFLILSISLTLAPNLQAKEIKAESELVEKKKPEMSESTWIAISLVTSLWAVAFLAPPEMLGPRLGMFANRFVLLANRGVVIINGLVIAINGRLGMLANLFPAQRPLLF